MKPPRDREKHIVMNRSKPQFAGLRLMLDSSSSFFLNLHECSSGKHWQMRNLSSCYRSRHRPLAHAVLDTGGGGGGGGLGPHRAPVRSSDVTWTGTTVTCKL